MFLDKSFPLVTSFQLLLFVPPEILATLRGHSGLVKGLTWDPVGKYIASQADDRSLKVWRTLDWQLETSITKPFDEVRARSPLSTRTHTASDAGQSCGVRAVPFSGAVKCPPLQWRDLCGLPLKRLQHAAPGWGWRPRLFLWVRANLHPGGRQPLRALSCPMHSIQSCDCSGSRTALPFSHSNSACTWGQSWGLPWSRRRFLSASCVYARLLSASWVYALLCPAVLVQRCLHTALELCLVGLPPCLHSLGPSPLGLQAAQG